MIKYNNSNINDWNYGASNLIKVYRNNAIVYYKVSGESPTPEYKVCFAVVDDITQYQETEFEDVYDKATEKWYKLNNLNQYEKYGVYASGRTSCEGSTSRLPQGYTEVEYIERNSTHNGYLPLGEYFQENTKIEIVFQMTQAKGNTIIGDYGSNDNDDWRVFLNYDASVNNWLVYDFNNSRAYYDTGDWSKRFHLEIGNYYIKDLNTGNYLINSTSKTGFSRPNQMYLFHMDGTQSSSNIDYGYIYSVKIWQGETLVKDFVPCKRDFDNAVGLYDIVNDEFHNSLGSTLSAGSPVTPTDCVTTYEGKLTIDDGYEYEWNGSSWVNLGEVSGSSRVPVGYIEVDYISSEEISESVLGAYIDTNYKPTQNTRFVIEYQSTTNTRDYQRIFGSGEFDMLGYLVNIEGKIGTSGYYYYKFGQTSSWYTTNVQCDLNRHVIDYNNSKQFLLDNVSIATLPNTSFTCSSNLGIFWSINTKYTTNNINFIGRIFSAKVYENGILVRDFVPCISPNNVVGMYDIVNNVFYTSSNNYSFKAGEPITPTEYPKYYSEKSDPLNDLTFNTLVEAQTYAYNNCVYDGLKAIIDGDRYYFDSSDENGWVKILEYYKVEDVTPSGGSGWTISGSSRYNPDSSYYDDFDLETNWTSNSYKIAKVTIYGYDHFTYYLRSYSYSSPYGYIYATNVDEIQTPLASMSYNSSPAITNTYYWNKSPKSDVNLSNYRRITYNNLDKTVEHTFYVYFYGRTYGSYAANATILIPKEQTNENWEQVTFSASSNVASAKKNLYIDNSTNGGTQYFYHRWIVGLPNGSHSSYTNYSSYNYCPNTTSSTFTSVAGEQRQVNFTYDGTVDKNLSFRLTDGSNVLTPSDTVYYNMTYYNSCGVSNSSSNVTFPRSQSVKVGGRFRFANSSNRHYIYGYSPNISLNTDYYVDNYQSTFDITYTKLSEEAVTITYTTYDPNDVETPAFKTDITYPYNGGTTSSTTLTSYDVPYTYPYEVSQTSGKFSADSKSYTANQAARTINFTLYPNNREFATVADMEAYQYAWEGMKATVGDTKYQYKNGEWVENQHSLPDVPFSVNFNAKNYNSSTKTLLKTSGQLVDVDAVITAGTPTVGDGYLTIASGTRATIEGYSTYFNRDNNNPNLTIISKQRTDGSNGHMFANRDSNYNWMYRCYSNKLTLHGTSEQGYVAVTTQPVIESVRIDSNKLATYNNYTDNTTSTKSGFSYGSTNSGKFAIFAGYGTSSGEWFVGDFYWVYMAQNTLTDEQVQQVIDYNENL